METNQGMAIAVDMAKKKGLMRVRRETLIGFKRWLKSKMTTVIADTQSTELKFDYEDVLLIVDFALEQSKDIKQYRKALEENLYLFKNSCGFFGRGASRERAERICKVLYGHEDVGMIKWGKN